jgi:hypothetical protein
MEIESRFFCAPHYFAKIWDNHCILCISGKAADEFSDLRSEFATRV